MENLNMKKIFALCVLCFSGVLLQSQPLVQGVKALGKQAVKSSSKAPAAGILDRLDDLYSSGEYAAQQAKLQSRVQAARERQIKYALEQRNSPVSKRKQILFKTVTPTNAQALPRLGHPFTGQEFTFSRQYQDAMKEFVQIHRDYVIQVGGRPAPVNFSFEEKRIWGNSFHESLFKLQKLQKIYPQDKPLQEALEVTYFCLGEINPMFKGLYEPPQPRPGRRFQREEFVLDPMWFDQMVRMAWSPRQAALPETLKVAVVNDDPTILHQYKLWQQQGLFKGWEFSFFSTAEAAVQDISSHAGYQLLITDWTVANSSVLESVRRLRTSGNTLPVIVCSSYTVDQINAQQMFNQGFDGFISWADVTASGPEHLTEGLKRFFFYKDYYKW